MGDPTLESAGDRRQEQGRVHGARGEGSGAQEWLATSRGDSISQTVCPLTQFWMIGPPSVLDDAVIDICLDDTALSSQPRVVLAPQGEPRTPSTKSQAKDEAHHRGADGEDGEAPEGGVIIGLPA